jgi:hypothetical protein
VDEGLFVLAATAIASDCLRNDENDEKEAHMIANMFFERRTVSCLLARLLRQNIPTAYIGVQPA